MAFEYMKRVMANPKTGEPSAKRWTLVWATIFLGIGLTGTIASIWWGFKPEPYLIWAFTLPLSLMAGASYSTVEIAKLKTIGVQPQPVSPDEDDEK